MKTVDPKRNKRIYLTGFMGSGKSTIGPILANTLGYEFVDVDKAIEKHTGQTVREIFAGSGEVQFREMERKLIHDLLAVEHIVISLGGGTIADPVNFPVIRSSGILVYLKSTPDHLFRRLHHKTDRPVLVDVNGDRLTEEALRTRIDELYAHREHFYEQADIIIPTDEHKVGITVDHIVKKLSGMLD
jgi:shikimate kinase